MGLTGKLFAQVEIKSDGDLFHHLFRHKPHHLSKISPKHVQSCDLHEGEFGKVGSVIFWKYVHGKTTPTSTCKYTCTHTFAYV